jgi:glycosyltransferase involved in cell wall biosynthesis
LPPQLACPTRDPAAAPVIGALGRLIPKKGFADLLEAAALLAARSHRFELQIGGRGPAEAALRAQVDRLGLAPRVRFLGWIEDKRGFFEPLEIVCVPSREEPFGIVVLEGMAHGRATIATDAPGPREIVRHGVDGLLVPRTAPDALAAAMALLLDHPERRLALARAARETVRARFDLPVVAQRLSAALQQVVERRVSDASAP